jgi:dihydrodipicolinate synthase/N-acetylneuraminate lyase
VKTTVEEVNGKVPVLTGTGFNPPISLRSLAKQAAAAGVNGILAFPPYYPSQDEEGIVAYYKGIADATPLGVIIYSRDWFAPSPSLVEKLAQQIPNLIAWKDGQADIRRYQMIRQHSSATGCTGSAARATTWSRRITRWACAPTRPASRTWRPGFPCACTSWRPPDIPPS